MTVKRNPVALIIQPYKNAVKSQSTLQHSINAFIDTVLNTLQRYANIRWNLVLPGYMLEYIHQNALLRLRTLIQDEGIDIITTGYTEPFLSLSPQWLLLNNIQHAMSVFRNKLGIEPRGYLPPFSNWEPSCLSTLTQAGCRYIVLSNAVFPLESRYRGGFWTTEHLGDSTAIIPCHTVKLSGHPLAIRTALEHAIIHARTNQVSSIKFLVDITATSPAQFDEHFSRVSEYCENNLIDIRPLTCDELVTAYEPTGIQYLPQSLVIRRDALARVSYFKNHLFGYEQIGILHRKMMENAANVARIENRKKRDALLHILYWTQDINCYLPGPEESSGFTNPLHRLWCYEKMIECELAHYAVDNISGGQIKIFDFFKTGMKSLTMSNKTAKLYIDYQNGGTMFAMDYRPLKLNLNATFAPHHSPMPNITSPGKSKTCFTDRLLLPSITRADYIQKRFDERSDLFCGKYDYDVTRTAHSLKALLKCNGSLTQHKKHFPLALEKVFTLQEKNPLLSFSYRLYNLSLNTLQFRIAIELNFMLPGVLQRNAFAISDKRKYNLHDCAFTFANTSQWRLEDRMLGLKLLFALHKPVDVWIYDLSRESPSNRYYQGTAIVLTTCINAEQNIDWSLTGSITFKHGAKKVASFDEI